MTKKLTLLMWKHRAILPIVVLTLLATRQITLSFREDMSPWKGGGFGMFSSFDGPSHRRLRFFATDSNGASVEVFPPYSNSRRMQNALIHPTSSNLLDCLRSVPPTSLPRGAKQVWVELWKVGISDSNLIFAPWKRESLDLK